MLEPIFNFSVTCPDCALKSVSAMPVAMIANRLLTGKALRLYSNCHDRYWTATFTEREQLRTALKGIQVDTLSTPSLQPNAKVCFEFETAS
jgi:hypothetical protein